MLKANRSTPKLKRAVFKYDDGYMCVDCKWYKPISDVYWRWVCTYGGYGCVYK